MYVVRKNSRVKGWKGGCCVEGEQWWMYERVEGESGNGWHVEEVSERERRGYGG